ncbi:MAG: hypothetical protein PHO67_08160 [Candidatus Omnitrophica bacterium]|nr:hypothetical protein [Candidatus Omnitrophota bacterium]
MNWLRDVNWGRLVIIFPIITFVLCFTSMVWSFIDRNVVDGAVMATMIGVNLGMVLVILYYTRREK